MSWNLIILPGDDADDATIGEAADVKARLDRLMPGIDWSTPEAGQFAGDGFHIEIGLQASGDVGSFTLHITGQGEPVALVVKLSRDNGWAVFDAVAGEYLDVDNPSDRGWAGYHAHIAGKVVPPDEQ